METEVLGRILTTLPDDDDHPYRTGPWRPQHTERASDTLEVIGEVPADLDGVYLRNTENPVHSALSGIYHPFDGDAMMHVVGFRDGEAFYRNRFVRTDGFPASSLFLTFRRLPPAEEPDYAGSSRSCFSATISLIACMTVVEADRRSWRGARTAV